ncbi:FliH/SctL family protein [Paramicrobacterium fandaimingii]|uniref:FliH/SctL family protein n=1 Tax=Paramicrobacterium fandaimingii TaxID=2708079 RepID=UPI00141F6DE2|nr:FliH/SctL family protein [Microbacterium fandaimingii]
MSTDGFTPGIFPRITTPESEREVERARLSGYAAGHAEGMRAAAEAAAAQRARIDAENTVLRREQVRQLERATEILDAAALSLAHREETLLSAAQSHVERLAVDLAEAVIARELDSDDESARNALHRALSVVDVHALSAVRLNPADIDVLHRRGGETAPIPLVADPAVAVGDAVAMLEDGTIDARLDAAFARVRSALSEGRS